MKAYGRMGMKIKLKIFFSKTNGLMALRHGMSESESELFTGDTSKDNHSPGPVFREVSP